MVPVAVTVTGQDVTVDGSQAHDGVPIDVAVPSLDDATSITIRAVDPAGQPLTYRVHSVPQARARYTVGTLSSPVKGQILLAPNQLVGVKGGPSFVYIVDETGRLLFYKETAQLSFDFQRYTLPDGTVRYAYITQDGPTDPDLWPIVPSTVFVLDDHFRQVREVRLAAAGAHADYGTDVHEFRMLDDDHWLLEAYMGETVTNVPGYSSAGVVSAVVQEVQAGKVLFDWETTSVPTLYTQSSDGNDFTNAKTMYADYNHLNSLDIDPSNGNIVVSLRHDDEVLELDRKTGAVLWTLGGEGDEFGLADADKSSHQHYVRFLGPGDLMMFDNGNAGKLTKIREYRIDEAAHTAKVLTAFSVDGHFSAAMGSVQKLDGRYFVGWGYRQDTESDVTEIDATTMKKTFELSFQDGYCSYRALKYP